MYGWSQKSIRERQQLPLPVRTMKIDKYTPPTRSCTSVVPAQSEVDLHELLPLKGVTLSPDRSVL